MECIQCGEVVNEDGVCEACLEKELEENAQDYAKHMLEREWA